ncbi:MAG: putative hydro-lyase [Pseudomonadota bacterium]
MLDPRSARRAIRDGAWAKPTATLAPGRVQANLVMLPREWAFDFLLFCQRNPKPCPLLVASEPGATALPGWAEDLDLRTDVPGYRVFEQGELVADVDDVRPYWRDDLVTFALGCSFSFEQAMLDAGLEVRHHRLGRNVPMYRTAIDCSPAGRFAGKMVVSMRPFRPADAIKAVQVTTRFPAVHGAPIHLGLPEAIGIADVGRADFGDDPVIEPGELPVFWACGVTPQVVLEATRPPFCITHRPGHMLITDRTNLSLAA